MEVLPKTILYGFIEGRIQFGMPRGVKMSLACPLMNRNRFLFIKFKHYLRACTTSGKKLLVLHAKPPMEYQRGPSLEEKPLGRI